MRKHRGDGVLNFRAQFAPIACSAGEGSLAVFQQEIIEIIVGIDKRQLACVEVEGKLVCLGAELHFCSNKSCYFGVVTGSIMRNREVLGYEIHARQLAAYS